MARNKKKNRLRQYHKVVKRRIKRLSRKKAGLWFKANLKQHPFVLGLVLYLWIFTILRENMFSKGNIIKLILSHCLLFILWLVLVILANLLKDKQKVKWYLRKRFVFFMLLLFPPLGLIFLWSGAQFGKITKIILTVVFGSIFIIYNVRSHKKYQELLEKPSFDAVVEMITKPKKKILLKAADKFDLADFRLTRVSGKARVKLAVSEIASRCSPAVVSIKTKDKEGRPIGLGSGFIISPDGVIITNFHVVESAYQAEVNIGEDIIKEAYLVKGIPELDIAILKIDSEQLPVLSIGDSDSLINGQFVVALGNPAGLERSVSSGIISALRTKGENKLIQMTAPVSPGSSGGPVINEYGEVIGITTLASFFMTQNLNFAVPINYLNKMISGKDPKD